MLEKIRFITTVNLSLSIQRECYGEIVIVRLKDGRVIEDEQIFMQGAAKRPLSMDDVIKKFNNCANEVGLVQIRKDGIISAVKDLENISDISGLICNFEDILR